MKVALHQPYFFPYIGYFSLMSEVDVFIFFDILQFKHRSWMIRNRILKPNYDWQYFNASTHYLHVYGLLSECKLKEDTKWKEKIIAQLEHYKKKAGYYYETIDFIYDLLFKSEIFLADFNVNSTIAIAKKLNIDTKIYRYSEIISMVEKPERGNLWGLNFCRALGGDAYINAPGGVEFYNTKDFNQAGIELGFIQHNLTPYSQNNLNFIPGLSIIDVLMFNGFEKTSSLIKDYRIVWAQKE